MSQLFEDDVPPSPMAWVISSFQKWFLDKCLHATTLVLDSNDHNTPDWLTLGFNIKKQNYPICSLSLFYLPFSSWENRLYGIKRLYAPRPQPIQNLGFKPRFSGFSLNLFVESKWTGEMELLLGSNPHSTHWQVCNFICIFDSSYQLLLSTKLRSSTYPPARRT